MKFFIGLLFIGGLTVQAQERDVAYFEITKVNIERIQDGGVDYMALAPIQGMECKSRSPRDFVVQDFDTQELNVSLGLIVNIGKKIWNLVEAGKPAVTVTSQVAHAMPQGITCWQDLTGWMPPHSYSYRISYENKYGSKVVDFTYRLSYLYGGQVNGKGRYLAQVSIVPANLSVAWGFKFNAESSVPMVYNMGTKENPVAGMRVDIKWSVDSIVSHNEQVHSFGVDGNGQIKLLN